MRQHTLTIGVLVAVATTGVMQGALISSWSGDGNADDSVGGRNGTLVGGAGFGAGAIGQAFSLDGTNDYVSVPDDPAWALGDFSISLWANFDTIRAGSLGSLPNVFVGQDEGGGATRKWVFVYDGTGTLAVHIFYPGFGTTFLTSTTPFTPGTGAWHHFAVTRSGSTFTFYGDGASLGTAASSLAFPDASASLTIGQAEGLGFIDGRLDEIQIYNNALSAAEIAALAQIPEPTSYLLCALGLSALAIRRTLRRR